MKAVALFLLLSLVSTTAIDASREPKRKPQTRRLRQQDLLAAFCMGAFVSHGLPYLYTKARDRLCPGFCVEADSGESSHGCHLSSSSSSSASISKAVEKDTLKLVKKLQKKLKHAYKAGKSGGSQDALLHSSSSESSSSSDRRQKRRRRKKTNDTTDWWKNSSPKERELVLTSLLYNIEAKQPVRRLRREFFGPTEVMTAGCAAFFTYVLPRLPRFCPRKPQQQPVSREVRNYKRGARHQRSSSRDALQSIAEDAMSSGDSTSSGFDDPLDPTV